MDKLDSLRHELYFKELEHSNKKAMYWLYLSKEAEEKNREEAREVFLEIMSIKKEIRLLIEEGYEWN